MSSEEHPFSSVAEQSYLETVICQYMPYAYAFVGSGVMGELFDPWGTHHCYFCKTVSMTSSEEK